MAKCIAEPFKVKLGRSVKVEKCKKRPKGMKGVEDGKGSKSRWRAEKVEG